MTYNEKFEDEGFVYELSVHSSEDDNNRLYVISQGAGYCCEWTITGKDSTLVRELQVTDDNCDPIVFHSLEAAVKGARDFLNI